MLVKEIVGDLSISSKVKSNLDKDVADFFKCMSSYYGVVTLTEDFKLGLNYILSKFTENGYITTNDKEKWNGILTIQEFSDSLDIPDVIKSVLLRKRKNISNTLDLSIKAHQQPLFLDELQENSSTVFETLLATKYLHKKIQAGRRGIDFTLTLTDMRRLLKTKRCYYTGVELTLEGATGLSLDRKDSALGYTKENTVACSSLANTLKEKLMEDLDVIKTLKPKEVKKMLLKFAELL